MKKTIKTILTIFLFIGFSVGQEMEMQKDTHVSLRENDFIWMRGTDMTLLSKRAVKHPKLSELAARIEGVLYRTFSNTWFPDSEKGSLLAIRHHGNQPDVFITRYEIEENQVELVVGEKRVTMSIILPEKDKKEIKDIQDVRLACNLWVNRLLLLPEEIKLDKIVVKESPSMWMVERDLKDFQNPEKKRYIPYTRIESLKVALNKDGKSISVSVNYRLPEIASGMPAGFRMRFEGNWFDDVTSNKHKGKKGDSHSAQNSTKKESESVSPIVP